MCEQAYLLNLKSFSRGEVCQKFSFSELLAVFVVVVVFYGQTSWFIHSLIKMKMV